MLSYQHAYHAGNRADVHKHAIYAELLRLLTEKSRGITVLETHAGRGLYDLCSPEAQKTNEAAEGIQAISIPRATAYSRAQSAVRAQHGPSAYGGSPQIAVELLRPQDRLILMERHPREHAALKEAMRGTAAAIHFRDGYEGVLAVSPPQPRRGIVLIDPSYEVKSEYKQAGESTATLHDRWPEAVIVVWYPLLAAVDRTALLDAVTSLAPLRHEVVFPSPLARAMQGSGLLIVNAPFGTDAAITNALSFLGNASPLFHPNRRTP